MDVDVVADYMILKGDKPNGEPLTQLGLQKLVYLCQGWHLALTDEILFSEDIYAYKHGPVVKELRQRFRFCADGPLPQTTLYDAEHVLSSGTRHIIDTVWSRYARMPTSGLVNLTHKPGSPWSQIWENTAPEDRDHLLIPVDIIRNYFKAELAEKLKPKPKTTRARNLAAAFEQIPAEA